VVTFSAAGRILCATTVALIATLSDSGGAQDLSKVFKEIDRIAVFGRFGGFTPADGLTATNEKSWSRYGHAGMGIELGYNIVPSDASWLFEGGIGYSQMGGFRLKRDDIDLRGTVRELPTVTFYALHNARVAGLFFPYLGVSSGFAKLQNAAIYNPDGDQYSVSAEAFTLGGSVGAAFGSRTISPFIEAGYRVRNFPSLEYKFGSSTRVPTTWPRGLNFSGWHLDVGVQAGLDALKAPKPAEKSCAVMYGECRRPGR
jgi:hypothetical protein